MSLESAFTAPLSQILAKPQYRLAFNYPFLYLFLGLGGLNAEHRVIISMWQN